MFADACQKAMRFTRPVMVSTRTHDGTCKTDVASMIVVNPEGWIITAAHLFRSYQQQMEDRKKIKEIEDINRSRTEKDGTEAVEIKIDNEFIVNHSFWWGMDGVRIERAYVDPQIDIALAKLTPFDPNTVKEYPVFVDPSHMRLGTSLCRAGFPFIRLNTEFDEKLNMFKTERIDSSYFYPTDGILSHEVLVGNSRHENIPMRFLETSSPGLKGQSGGPLFDVKGLVYGMQIRTDSRDLGFHPTAQIDGQKYIENQFYNVGIAVHAKTIMDFLDAHKVKYTMEGDDSGFRIIG